MINDQQNHTAATCADVSPSTSAAAASKEILTLAEIKKFRVSYGWCRRFMNRYRFSMRRISGSGRSFKPDTPIIIAKYLREIRELIREHGFTDDEIFNFDESSFYMDAVGAYTVAQKGSRKTYAKTTGHEKVRLSCLMCATASGKKLKILCVVPRKKRIAALEENPDMVIIYETKGIYFKFI